MFKDPRWFRLLRSAICEMVLCRRVLADNTLELVSYFIGGDNVAWLCRHIGIVSRVISRSTLGRSMLRLVSTYNPIYDAYNPTYDAYIST